MRIYLAVLALTVAALLNGFRGTGPFLALAVAYLTMAALEPRHILSAMKLIGWVSVLCASLAVAQTLHEIAQAPTYSLAAIVNGGIQAFLQARPPSFWPSANILGASAAVCFFLCLELGHRYLAVTNLVAVGVSQSRGALLAVLAGVFVLLRPVHRWIAAAAVIPALVVATAIRGNFDQAPIIERYRVWEAGIASAKWHLLTGNGFGSSFVFANGTFYHRFYSIPIDWFAATGIAGLVAGCWLICAAWSRSEARPLLAAWLVQGFFISAHPATMVPFFAALALATGRGAAGVEGDKPGVAGVVLDREPLADRG